jgi:hypothetical protein
MELWLFSSFLMSRHLFYWMFCTVNKWTVCHWHFGIAQWSHIQRSTCSSCKFSLVIVTLNDGNDMHSWNIRTTYPLILQNIPEEWRPRSQL